MRIKNWDKFNYYNVSNPKYRKEMTWFKIYGRDILNNLDCKINHYIKRFINK